MATTDPKTPPKVGDKLTQIDRQTELPTGRTYKVEKVFQRSIEIRCCSPTTGSLIRVFFREGGILRNLSHAYEAQLCESCKLSQSC